MAPCWTAHHPLCSVDSASCPHGDFITSHIYYYSPPHCDIKNSDAQRQVRNRKKKKRFKGKCSGSAFLFFEIGSHFIAQASLGFTLQFRLAMNFWPSFYLKLPSTRISGSTHHTCLYPSSSSSSSFPSLDDKFIALLFTIYLQDH